MRFAFLIMGKFDSREDQAVIHNGTARIIGVSEATGNRIRVGYVTHLPEQDDVYRKAFAGK